MELFIRRAGHCAAVLVLAAASTLARADDADTTPSLWPRLCAGMQLQAPDNPAVEKWARKYTKSAPHFTGLLARGEPYLWHITEAIAQRGYPMEIALLPAIESGFDARARSQNRAIGLWQFVASTARRYKLRDSDWYDGRRDVIASTDAALDYLTDLQDIFDDWPLALAAYNVGENRVMRAAREQRRKGNARSFWQMDLPLETRGHVPRLLGLAQAVCNPGRYGVSLPPVADAPYSEAVTLPGQIDLNLAAKWSGVPVKDLYALNPALRLSATDPDGPNRLLLPAGRGERLQLAIAEVGPKGLMRYTRHVIRDGESLSVIAEQAGVSLVQLRRVNGLRGNLIRAGDALLVPVAAKAAPLAEIRPRNRERHQHVVAAGDSLWALARQYGVSVRELADWNRMPTSAALRIGRSLTIWLPPAATNP